MVDSRSSAMKVWATAFSAGFRLILDTAVGGAATSRYRLGVTVLGVDPVLVGHKSCVNSVN